MRELDSSHWSISVLEDQMALRLFPQIIPCDDHPGNHGDFGNLIRRPYMDRLARRSHRYDGRHGSGIGVAIWFMASNSRDSHGPHMSHDGP